MVSECFEVCVGKGCRKGEYLGVGLWKALDYGWRSAAGVELFVLESSLKASTVTWPGVLIIIERQNPRCGARKGWKGLTRRIRFDNQPTTWTCSPLPWLKAERERNPNWAELAL
jgi:hypothetical protein